MMIEIWGPRICCEPCYKTSSPCNIASLKGENRAVAFSRTVTNCMLSFPQNILIIQETCERKVKKNYCSALFVSQSSAHRECNKPVRFFTILLITRAAVSSLGHIPLCDRTSRALIHVTRADRIPAGASEELRETIAQWRLPAWDRRTREPPSELQLMHQPPAFARARARVVHAAVGQGDAEGWCGTTSFRLARVADPTRSLFLFLLSSRRGEYLVDSYERQVVTRFTAGYAS